MSCNYVSHIISQGKRVRVLRREPVEYGDDGYPKARKTLFNKDISASVQPLTGFERLQLEKGDRNREHLWIWTNFVFQTDDTVYICDKEYELRPVEDWTNQGFSYPYTRALAVLKDVNKLS